jgi:uncharacterized phage protein gp47/JayE
MAFNTPDLRTLKDRAESHIEAELPGENARLRRSNLNVLAKVMAMIAHGMYGFIREFLSQCLPWTKGFLLRQWAEIWNIFTIAATQAQGAITFTGTNGTPIAAGSLLQATDGREYTTLSAVAIAAGVATVDVVAVVAGTAGNLAAGTVLTLVNTIGGVNSDATVGAGGVTGGLADESPDSLYSRFVQRVRNPAHGGNDEDYKGWAREVLGVTRVWVYGGLDGADTVQVFFVRDGDPVIIPNGAAVAAVQAYINAPGRKPVAASVGVYAPVAKVVNFSIAAVPNTAAVKAAIETALRDLITREADLAGTLLLSHLNEAISLAAGESDHVMSVPAANVVCASNEICTFGAITWL